MEPQIDLEQTVEGYTLEELERLERQYKVRSFIKRSEEKVVEDSTAFLGDPDPGAAPLWVVMTGSLPAGISDVEKLKLVRERRERYLETSKQTGVNFLIKMNSVESPILRARQSEVKGRSYWYRKTQEDYVQNWFLKYTPVRRYFEEVTLETLDESNIDKLGDRFFEITQQKMYERDTKALPKRS